MYSAVKCISIINNLNAFTFVLLKCNSKQFNDCETIGAALSKKSSLISVSVLFASINM